LGTGPGVSGSLKVAPLIRDTPAAAQSSRKLVMANSDLCANITPALINTGSNTAPISRGHERKEDSVQGHNRKESFRPSRRFSPPRDSGTPKSSILSLTQFLRRLLPS